MIITALFDRCFVMVSTKLPSSSLLITGQRMSRLKRDDCNTSPCPIPRSYSFVPMEAAIGAIVQFVNAATKYGDVSNTYVDYGDQSFDILF
jgi:hypothetical protein